MTSKDVINYLKVEGIDKLYKKFQNYFLEVDKWSERFSTGDLLNEYELSQALDRLTGIYMKFHIIAEAIDAHKTNIELNYSVNAFKNNKTKINVSQIDKEARESTGDYRIYRGDFLNYSEACEKAILTCQARMKRLTIEKGARGIDFTGDTSNIPINKEEKAW